MICETSKLKGKPSFERTVIVLKFLSDFSTKPIYFFGGFSIFSFIAAFIMTAWSFYLKFAQGVDLDATPLLIFAAVFIIVSVQLLLMGILADLIMRTYFESQDKKTYQVRESINLIKEMPTILSR